MGARSFRVMSADALAYT